MGLFGLGKTKTRQKGENPESSTGGSPQREGGVELVRFRNAFYQDEYRNKAAILHYGAVTLLTSVLLNGALGWALIHKKPVYFAATNDGRILPLVPLSRPATSDRSVVSWATSVATSAYSYDFVNWRKVLSGLSSDFTKEGFASFIGSLKSSGNLKLVSDNRMVASAVPTEAGVIVAKGLLKGVYVWKVQVPILVTYQAAKSSVSQNLLVTLLIVRRSVLVHPKGLAVAQFLATERKVS
ncbi:MAG: IcmL protein [Leptospirillum sp. Group II 'C75']|jgi:intracellular multiplication protein IcmL|uniref:type IVB secretion system apparatus protein IcmL/DotI n=1 Tax=Leptospirillum sp. Group II 'CF-1' TaxID=1660083 RepID=UPI00029CD3AD|nr:type IVB secretion system apparatus protein IcmL/DotI [Leptospirillum sp. Group II 'CF-1']EIJ75144.1 MAG: IcmL protein [Leptospirillum sp. Group II 'C75']